MGRGRPRKEPPKPPKDNNVFSLFGGAIENEKAEMPQQENKPVEKYEWGSEWLSPMNDFLFEEI